MKRLFSIAILSILALTVTTSSTFAYTSTSDSNDFVVICGTPNEFTSDTPDFELGDVEAASEISTDALLASVDAPNIELDAVADAGSVADASNSVQDAPLVSRAASKVEDVTVAGNVAAVPEPSTVMLLGMGLLGVIGFARKRASR